MFAGQNNMKRCFDQFIHGQLRVRGRVGDERQIEVRAEEIVSQI